ncbi:UDP-N-acetylmuramoylalanine--D-glutamate ligase [Thermincola ferriacetica]|uniref:UDP-N-acetylmuramoylalanine--D-glutamate ligase n=1 Tax=Thermincola ferriacetica TaxID=281456 RepID=A0A0L6W539_9FIRM|nr:UDP-N-acetylmuramoyl-L-alanine--D-glutamate ligase [Thermincola ferriacetica]KNZ70473.1 UDP-N-acetylmuramoylalanine--D-glutamate ligase [Thermincola ferriacetica]
MEALNLKNKRVLVVGIGKSGLAVAGFLAGKGASVTITDKKARQDLGQAVNSLPKKVTVAAGAYPEVTPDSFDMVVTSPGVPLTEQPLRQALERKVPLLSELELAYRFARSPVVAITGTNGKTTTTTLTGEIFKAAGRRVLVGGNIGLPLVAEVEKYAREDIIVAEVSSFQLECIHRFKPKVSIILNFTPDHLDRHGTFENYILAKARIFENQGPEDFAVLNFDDPKVAAWAEQVKAQVIFFSRRHKLEKGVYVRQDRIIIDLGQGSKDVCSVKDIFIRGNHNLENALAATAAAAALGVEPEVIAEVLRTFRGVPHRMEHVAEIDGVVYINDSKGTNPDAAMKALDSYDQPLVLIAGGRNKGSDFTAFAAKVREKVRALVVLGECADEIIESMNKVGFSNIYRAHTLEEAVRKAAEVANPGEIVLLSPACASWDMFKDFEQRGEKFKEVVLSLRR